MRRLREILVGLDGSAAGYHALKESIRLARWSKGRVTAMAVTLPFEGDLSLVGLRSPKAAMEGSAESILDAACEMAVASGMELGVIWESGNPAERIAERARDGGFDVVVLGLQRAPSLRKTLFGTLHAQLASLARMDILVVPESSEIAWERTLYWDWLSEPSKDCFLRALDYSRAYGSRFASTSLASSMGECVDLSFCDPSSVETIHQSLNATCPKDSRRRVRTKDANKRLVSLSESARVGMLFLPYPVGFGLGCCRRRWSLESTILESPFPAMILPI